MSCTSHTLQDLQPYQQGLSSQYLVLQPKDCSGPPASPTGAQSRVLQPTVFPGPPASPTRGQSRVL